MAKDQETAKYLAEKSKEMIDKQISSHRQKQSNAATIIGVNALFIPFFLGGLSDSFDMIKYFSAIPILAIAIAIGMLLYTYSLTPLKQGLRVVNYDEVIKKDFTSALLYEIGINRGCFNANTLILNKNNRLYNWAVILTMSSIAFSIILLTINLLFKPKSSTIKVEISKNEIIYSPTQVKSIIQLNKTIHLC